MAQTTLSCLLSSEESQHYRLQYRQQNTTQHSNTELTYDGDPLVGLLTDGKHEEPAAHLVPVVIVEGAFIQQLRVEILLTEK